MVKEDNGQKKGYEKLMAMKAKKKQKFNLGNEDKESRFCFKERKLPQIFFKL